MKDTSVNVHELKDAKKQLRRHVKNAESVLGDVQATVQLVEKDREKFSRIDSAELYERKAFVNTSQDRLQMAKQELNSDAVKAKVLADERSKALRRADGMMGAETEGERQNTDMIVDSQARASVLMRQQDETLDELGVAVTRVGHMAGNIQEEIGAQNVMLDEMDEDLANAEEQLGMVMGKLGKLLKTKDKCQLGLIMCLLFTVILLFLLVIYT
jgi:syntaxin 6